MEWRKLTKNEAENIMKKWGKEPEINCISEFEVLRQSIISIEQNVNNILSYDSSRKSNTYLFDLYMGIEIYDLLTNQYQMVSRIAADDGIWRYIQINIVPDVVFHRWDNNPSRFWRDSRRIWLKSLWWYVHLSWQGNKEKTLKILSGNTTDEVVQLVERSGPYGYRVELCRQIMRYYSSIDSDKKSRGQQLFRKAMKLNTARIKVVEPALVTGGEQAYVKQLFSYFE